MTPLWGIVIRSVVVYLCLIIGIRIFGKKELSQLSVVDLVFILLISNSVQNAMVGQDVTLWGGLTAALALFVVNYLLKLLFFKSRKISAFFQGDPLMLIYHGKPIAAHLAQAKITMDELDAAIREHGVDNIKHVDLAVQEIDGSISILSDNFKRQTTKHRKPHKVISQTQ